MCGTPGHGGVCDAARCARGAVHLAGWDRGDRAGPGARGPDRRRRGGGPSQRDGPLLPDGGDVPRGRADAGGLHDAGLPGRPHLEAAPRPPGHRRDLPASGAAGEDRHNAGRALGRAGGARDRHCLVRPRALRPGRTVPANSRAVRAAGGDAADLPADVERRQRPVRRPALPAR